MTVPARSVLGGLAVLMLLVPAGSEGQEAGERIARENKEALVFLETSVTLSTGEIVEGKGTGFLLGPQGYVLTASHVLSPEGRYDKATVMGSPRTRHGRLWPLDVIKDEPDRDLLLLKFKDVGIEWSGVTLGAPAQTPDGAVLYVIGFPLNLDQSIKSGELSSKNGDGGTWITTVPLNRGDSGAPVLDREGRVVALVVGGIPGAQGISHVVPLNYAATLLTIVGVSIPAAIPPKWSRPPRLLSPPDGADFAGGPPRTLPLSWSEIAEARSYRLQVEIQDPVDSQWHPHPNGLGNRVVARFSYTIEFVGDQGGRWRVAAINADGDEGRFSAWSHFAFNAPADCRDGRFPFEPSVLLEYSYSRDPNTCKAFFLADGLGRWAEVSFADGGCLETSYFFEQVSRSGDVVTIHDSARGYYVRLPLRGGWATMSQSSAGPFDNLHRVERITAPRELCAGERDASLEKQRAAQADLSRIKREIQDLRGTYQSISDFGDVAAQEVVAKAPRLVRAMLSLPDSNLNLAHRIAKYHYAGYAALMAASASRTTHGKVAFSAQALEALTGTFALLEDARAESATGDPLDQELWEWIVDDLMEERTLYLLAVAQAIGAQSQGGSGHEALTTLRRLEAAFPGYLERYSPSANPYLQWAQASTGDR